MKVALTRMMTVRIKGPSRSRTRQEKVEIGACLLLAAAYVAIGGSSTLLAQQVIALFAAVAWAFNAFVTWRRAHAGWIYFPEMTLESARDFHACFARVLEDFEGKETGDGSEEGGKRPVNSDVDRDRVA